MAEKSMTLGVVQTLGNCSLPERFDRLKALIREAAGKGAGLIILPELIFHDYFCVEEDITHFNLAHGCDDSRMRTLQALAAEVQAALVVPFFEKRGPGLYHNSLAVYDADGSDLGLYRKMHIPDDPGFMEKYYFIPGDLGFKTFTTRHAKVGTLICWDQWFPEAARLTAMQGSDLLCYPTAIGWDRKEWEGLAAEEVEALKARQLDAWITIQRSHAIANGVYVVAANRIGEERHLVFWGHSFIAGPQGEILARLDDTTEGVLVVECPLADIDLTRRVWPFFRDRRIDSFGDLQKRFLI